MRKFQRISDVWENADLKLAINLLQHQNFLTLLPNGCRIIFLLRDSASQEYSSFVPNFFNDRIDFERRKNSYFGATITHTTFLLDIMGLKTLNVT